MFVPRENPKIEKCAVGSRFVLIVSYPDDLFPNFGASKSVARHF